MQTCITAAIRTSRFAVEKQHKKPVIWRTFRRQSYLTASKLCHCVHLITLILQCSLIAHITRRTCDVTFTSTRSETILINIPNTRDSLDGAWSHNPGVFMYLAYLPSTSIPLQLWLRTFFWLSGTNYRGTFPETTCRLPLFRSHNGMSEVQWDNSVNSG